MIKFKRILLMASLPALAVVLALTVLFLRPSHASAETLVPFQASVSGTFTAAQCGQWAFCISFTGSGQATHLGAFTENASVVVDINPADAQNGCGPETFTATLTAANGDTLTMHATGVACHATGTAHDNFTITGGTGRFQGASGSGTDSNTHTFTGPGAGVATTTYSGVLSSVGSLTS
jgi:hypothetical protein